MRNGKTVLCEVGVGPPSMSYAALLWGRPDIEVMLFEPNLQFYRELVIAAQGRPNVELHNVAIGDENGTTQFVDEGTSSTLAGIASPFAQHYKKPESEKRKYDVQVRRISEFDRGDIDILRVDTEGAEWLCLKHLVSRPRQIVVEIYNDLATYINPYLYEIVQWAGKEGYKLVSISNADFTYQR